MAEPGAADSGARRSAGWALISSGIVSVVDPAAGDGADETSAGGDGGRRRPRPPRRPRWRRGAPAGVPGLAGRAGVAGCSSLGNISLPQCSGIRPNAKPIRAHRNFCADGVERTARRSLAEPQPERSADGPRLQRLGHRLDVRIFLSQTASHAPRPGTSHAPKIFCKLRILLRVAGQRIRMACAQVCLWSRLGLEHQVVSLSIRMPPGFSRVGSPVSDW